MKTKLHRASAIAVAATLFATLASAEGSGALARENDPATTWLEPVAIHTAAPIIRPMAAEAAVQPEIWVQPEISAQPEILTEPETPAAPQTPSSLAELVAAQAEPAELSREIECLAGAVYFEAKSESLAGQLAVGRVVVARSRSGRFPGSYCGVVFQPSQFSFVRGQSMPGIVKTSRFWRNAVAIARIAHEGSWRSPVEGALFFHAARVSPRWRLTRIARVENHVFYR